MPVKGTLNAIERSSAEKCYGVVIGVVTDIKNPDGNYMLKVRYPHQDNGSEEGGETSFWCRIATLWAHTKQDGSETDNSDPTGWHCLPEIKDEVVVAFEHGDFNRPIIIGSLYNSKCKPVWDNKNKDSNNNDTRKFTSRNGHELIFNDKKDDKGWVEFHTKQGHSLKMVDKDGSEYIKLIDKSGKEWLHFDTANGKITLQNDQGDMLIQTKGELKIEADKITAHSKSDTKFTADATFKVNATSNCELNTSAEGKFTASGNMTIKGAIVNIN
jgi:uncharacterized protein involved in type VI secretion and phage assembly